MMTNPITSQGAPKSARYGTSAQQEATATKSTQTSASSPATIAASTSADTKLPPISKVQATAKVEKAVTDINEYVQTVSRDLQFSIEEELPLGRAVIRVIDSETKELIREFPSEEVIAIAQRINEQLEDDEGVDSFMISEQA